MFARGGEGYADIKSGLKIIRQNSEVSGNKSSMPKKISVYQKQLEMEIEQYRPSNYCNKRCARPVHRKL